MAADRKATVGSGERAGKTERRIGVTGHRCPPKLPDVARDRVRATVAQLLAGVARSAPSHLKIVSSLAEGADQIVAEEGLRLGAALDAILPFTAAEYRHDFKDVATARRFDALCTQSRRLVALDGARSAGAVAYEDAGHAMLDASDAIITIWDGQPASGRGGTAEIVARAMSLGLPVVRIDPSAPDELRVLSPPLRAGRSDLASAVAALASG